MNEFNMKLGKYDSLVEEKLSELNDQKIISRIWERDHTVWREDPTEISNRLGWLDCADVAKTKIDEINEFVEQIKTEGFTHALLLGMGGSSLAPEVFKKILGTETGYLDLSVLDSTHPDQVKSMIEKFDPNKTLFIVSTKSGGTVETISFMKTFYNQTISSVGKEKVGNHFIAITDPGSGLEQMAKELNFREIFINDPNIGGRYSALSLFGLVPVALMGVNLNILLTPVDIAILESKSENNPISKLGVALGVLANNNVDKVTYILSNKFKPFGAWVEQLIAESTGKDGKGILPVEGEEILTPEEYSRDRVFVYIHTKHDNENRERVNELINSEFPVIEIELNDLDELGAQFFSWEMATVIASWVIDIQPYDQPNVEEAKIIARKMMSEYLENGKLIELTPIITDNNIKVYGDVKSESIHEVLPEFLQNIDEGKSYIAIQAYVNMNDEAEKALHEFRTKLQKKYKVTTTVGFGPRFLHSTGQLHKGDAGNGLFIQIVSKNMNDVNIPDEAGKDGSSVTFGVLLESQALGDRGALLENNRKIIRFDISENIAEDIVRIF